MNDPDVFVEGIYLPKVPGTKKSIEKKAPTKPRPAKPKRGQANKRERVRTENVNAGFDSLRKLIPTDPKDRKLSKIEVLRLATSYINHLFNLTRANSCLEAEAMARQIVLESGQPEPGITDAINNLDSQLYAKSSSFLSCESQETGSVSTSNSITITQTNNNKLKPINRYHVCTFCLMMTKTTAPSAANKRK